MAAKWKESADPFGNKGWTSSDGKARVLKKAKGYSLFVLGVWYGLWDSRAKAQRAYEEGMFAPGSGGSRNNPASKKAKAKYHAMVERGDYAGASRTMKRIHAGLRGSAKRKNPIGDTYAVTHANPSPGQHEWGGAKWSGTCAKCGLHKKTEKKSGGYRTFYGVTGSGPRGGTVWSRSLPACSRTNPKKLRKNHWLLPMAVGAGAMHMAHRAKLMNPDLRASLVRVLKRAKIHASSMGWEERGSVRFTVSLGKGAAPSTVERLVGKVSSTLERAGFVVMNVTPRYTPSDYSSVSFDVRLRR